jgi:hypothetical protein
MVKHGVISMIQRPNGVEIAEFLQAKEATDVEVQDCHNVHLLFRHQVYHSL